MEHVSVDLWAANLQVAPESLQGWLSGVEARLQQAATRGAALLVMPEFCCAQWLSFAPAGLPAQEQLGWLAETAVEARDEMRRMVRETGVALLPGTFPVAFPSADAPEGYLNQAWFLTPEGGLQVQNKLSLTPLEANGASGVTIAGTGINVFEWQGLRCVIAVCLDAEYTALWSKLGGLDLDLVLIPAKTDMITGYNRVFSCARARAIELQTAVCCVGAVGAPLTPWQQDTGVGGASVYLPCDVSVALDGLHAALPPQTAAHGTDLVLQAVGIPVGQCRRIRHGAAEAEVRPGLWSGDHLTVEGEAA
ncbi:nitrilase-related carbon-nitrogen hydrolase [Sulfitobacter sp. PS-8MA]|uniref:nitrilase-related carbon-nitrogen hydrolase n=1 Tax=Sulfitobacter sp. PS-8MA TaxID=3237707 RepID=UPI0034C5EFC2